MDRDPAVGEAASLSRVLALEVAETVRRACVDAALEGYERAQLAGLCREGAWECAVDAIRLVDVEALVRAALGTGAAAPAER